jgi:hypothetical protein
MKLENVNSRMDKMRERYFILKVKLFWTEREREREREMEGDR